MNPHRVLPFLLLALAVLCLAGAALPPSPVKAAAVAAVPAPAPAAHQASVEAFEATSSYSDRIRTSLTALWTFGMR